MLIVCGTPSSVSAKSLAVSPSMGRPSLSVTVTSTMVSCAPLRNVGCCAVRRTSRAHEDNKSTHRGERCRATSLTAVL